MIIMIIFIIIIVLSSLLFLTYFYLYYYHHYYSADSRFAPRQWETSLQSNGVSHWLGAYLESALIIIDGDGEVGPLRISMSTVWRNRQ